jgi:hypothetical protein
MSDTEFDPRENPELKSLVQKAIWIVRTFGYWRWSPVPLPVRTGIYPKKLRNNFIFEWENIRINAFQTVPIPKADDSDLLQDEDPNLIISLKRKKEVRLFGIALIRYHCFQEVYVSDLSGERGRLKILEGADLTELASTLDQLHDTLQQLITRSAMSVEQIKKLPQRKLNKLLKDCFVSRFKN